MAKAHATRKSAHQSKTTANTATTAGSKHGGCHDRTNRKDIVSVKPKERTIFEVDEELNSGFGGYLHSGPGHTMIKLFVLGNTLLILVTVAWPHIRDTLFVIRNMLLD